MTNFRYITIHAAATYPSMDIDVNWIRNIHVNQNKWSDVGYHWFIKRDGTAQEGRPEHITGAHTKNFNTGNLGVCLAGGLKEGTKQPEDNYTKAQWITLNQFLDEKLKSHPNAKLMGHNDFKGHESRGCPCFNQHVYFDWLLSARKALYKPADWYKQDWHNHSPDAWMIPNDFYQATFKVESGK